MPLPDILPLLSRLPSYPTSVLDEEIADEEGDDFEDKELEIVPEAPPPPVDDVADEAHITVDADLAAADTVDKRSLIY